MMIKKACAVIPAVIAVIFAVNVFFTVIIFNPCVVFAQDDADLFEEMEDTIKEKKKAIISSDEDLFNEMEESGEKSLKQASDEDLFGEMEDTPPQETGETRYAWVGKIWENLEGSLRIRYHYFFKKLNEREGLDNSSNVGETLFRFSTWSAIDNLKIHVSGWAEIGTQDDTYQGASHWMQDPDYYRRYFELNELYAFFSEKNFDVTIGRKLFTTGISTLFSPSDRFRPADLHDPLDPKQLGTWQIKTDYYLDDYKLEFAVIPVYTDKKSPAPSSRWWGNKDEQTYDLNNLPVGDADSAEDDAPNISWKYIDYFAKVKTTRSGWDFFMSTNSGPNPYSVVKEEGSTRIRKIVRIYTLAGGFSTTKGNFEIHGESLYNYTDESKDDDYLSSVIGLTYTLDDYARYLLMEKIIFTFEYAGEVILDKQSAENYTESSRDGRLGTNDFLSRIQFKYDEDLKLDYQFHYELSESSWMNRAEISYRIRDGLTLSCAVEFFESKDDATNSDQSDFDNISYAQWDDNDRIVVSLKYKF